MFSKTEVFRSKCESSITYIQLCNSYVTGADTLKFAAELNLANLKPDVDKLDIDKLKNVPTDLSYSKSK